MTKKPKAGTPAGISNTYWAGLFDGEGCVRILKREPRKENISPEYYIRAAIEITDKKVVELLKQRFGGIEMEDEHIGENRKPTYTWQLSNIPVKDFLEIILPFSIIKKERIKVALELDKRLKRKGGGGKILSKEEINDRETLFQKMKELNKIGKKEI